MDSDAKPLADEESGVPAHAALVDALEERNRLWADAHRTRALEQDLAHMQGMLETMQRSASWRLTAPLRAMKTVAGRQRGRAARVSRRARSRFRRAR
jgi:hypothetical protein